jgi:hemoglobin
MGERQPPVPRLPVTEADIRAVVRGFYAKVRTDPALAPVFAAQVADWPSHEEKITRFWCNAILHQRGYDGNPMQVHRAASNIRPTHFARWLAAFDETLAEELPPEAAATWSLLAHRIGRGLQLGLTPIPPPTSAHGAVMANLATGKPMAVEAALPNATDHPNAS